MTQKDIEFIKAVAEALGKVPKAQNGLGAPSATVEGHVRTAEDYGESVQYASVALNAMADTEIWKNILKSRDDIDPDEVRRTISECERKKKASLEKLKVFIEERTAQAWR